MSSGLVLRFGAFELNAATGELRQRGDLIKLPPQPFKVLELLTRRLRRAQVQHQEALKRSNALAATSCRL